MFGVAGDRKKYYHVMARYNRNTSDITISKH